jgi:hypothetical protein
MLAAALHNLITTELAYANSMRLSTEKECFFMKNIQNLYETFLSQKFRVCREDQSVGGRMAFGSAGVPVPVSRQLHTAELLS